MRSLTMSNLNETPRNIFEATAGAACLLAIGYTLLLLVFCI